MLVEVSQRASDPTPCGLPIRDTADCQSALRFRNPIRKTRREKYFPNDLKTPTLFIATRGSALALAQANTVLARCQEAFPRRRFELKIIKTTGDKLQTASMANEGATLPKGLFTKEIEEALLAGEASLAVHSLKDLPTDLPSGLKLGATLERADVRDVLLYRSLEDLHSHPSTPNAPADWAPGQKEKRGFKPHLTLQKLPKGATIATSSTRRAVQLQALRPDLTIIPIRGNVGTRIQKLADLADMDATILAAAGLSRLHFQIRADGRLSQFPHHAKANPHPLPPGILASFLEPDDMVPCVGQGAIGLEIRENDLEAAELCSSLNHINTFQCVTAERAFLRAMGGGCQSPVGAYADVLGHEIRFRAISFQTGKPQRAELRRIPTEAAALGEAMAARLNTTQPA